MKKVTAVLVALLLMVGLLTCGVSAEGFTFREISREYDGMSVLVTWNHTEVSSETEIGIAGVKVCDQSVNFLLEPDGRLRLDLSTMTPRIPCGIEYTYTVDGKLTSTFITLTFEVNLSAVINEDGTVTITAKDLRGVPIHGYRLNLTIGNMSGITAITDKDGVYHSSITLDPGQTLFYEGVGNSLKNGVRYETVERQSLVRPMPTTTKSPTTTAPITTVPSTTVTTETTVPTTTQTDVQAGATTVDTPDVTYATILGAGTTANEGDKVALNVSLDEGVLGLFGGDRNAFADRARLLVSKNDYSSLVGRANNVLMLNVTSPAAQASAAQVQAALNGVSTFSHYTEQNRDWFTFDLSLLILDKDGSVIPVSALPVDSTYVVQLPVPESMKQCDTLAITVQDGDGLMQPMEVAVSNGCFRLEINSLEAYTLIGFTGNGLGRAGGVSWWVVLLYVLGVLLLAGAGVLLYLFVFRKPAPVEQEPAAQAEEDAPAAVVLPEDDGNDIFSGRTDMPSFTQPPSDDE